MMKATRGRSLKTCLLASVGIAAMLAAGPASAAKKVPAPPPVPVETWSWAGVYVGGHGGYGWARDPFTDDFFFGKAPPLTDISANGFLGGFQAGANWQSGSWVGGLEIDLSATNIKGSSASSVSPGFAFTQTDKLDAVGSGRVRLGYLPAPNVLLYGTGGLAWTRFVERQEAINLVPGFGFDEVQTTPSWRFGAAAGAGVETRIGDSNWLGRVEYLHYDFGKDSTKTFSNGRGDVTRGDMSLDVVRAGLSYKLGLGFAGSGGSAMAAAMPVKALSAAPWTWSGFYIGGHAGHGWGHDPLFKVVDLTTVNDVDSNGFVGGFQAGANWQMGAWLGGLELDLSGTDLRGSSSGTAPFNGFGFTGTEIVTVSDKFDLLGSARVRLGGLLWPDVLFYGTGGLAWTRMHQTTDEAQVVTPGGLFAQSTTTANWEFGWVAGAGVEARLWSSNWLGRIEYLHYDFGDSGSSFDTIFTPPVQLSSGHLTADVVRGGLSYKFDWSNPSAVPARVAMPLKARPAVLATADWSGFYVGGHAGYGWASDPVTVARPGFIFPDPEANVSLNSSGLVGGFQAGANRQMGAFVGGLEIDMSASGIKGSSSPVSVGFFSHPETNTDKLDTLGTARARAGYLASPNVLLYGTGGLAWTRLDQSALDAFPTFGSAVGASAPSWELGWVAGGGGETRLADTNWFLRAEYLHYDFGDPGSPPLTVPGQSTRSSGRMTADVVRGALSYKLY